MFVFALHFLRGHYRRCAKPLLCLMKKKYYFSQKKSGSEPCAKQDFRSISGISLPAFPFEFSVEQASNRMIDIRSNKGFKADSTFIY